MSETPNLTHHPPEHVRNVAEVAAPAVRIAARLGYAARASVYCLIGILAGMAAVGSGAGRLTDTRGVLETIVAQPFGRAILVVIAVGFFAFAVWLFILGVEDPDRSGTSLRGIIARAGKLLGAVGYLSLMVTAIHILIGARGRSGENTARDWSAWAMTLPLGRLAVAVVGLVIIIVGFVNIFAAARRDIGRMLDHQRLTGRARQTAVIIGRIGIAARGLVFCLIGGFLAIAAWHANPREAHGLAGALHYVEKEPYGPWLLAAVAAGFVAYGAFEFVEARYRRVDSE
jgi:hypothetical protein